MVYKSNIYEPRGFEMPVIADVVKEGVSHIDAWYILFLAKRQK